MRLLLPLIAALVLVLAPSAQAGQVGEFKIIGGSAASRDYPAQAEVDVDLGFTGELCGGTLVDPQWVLTAAHCVGDQLTNQQFTADSFTVRLGSQTLGAGAPTAVDQVYRYPTWDNVSFRGDAALLHLVSAVPQTPLPLITDATLGQAGAGAVARVIGWGYTSENGVVSDQLLEVDVHIASDEDCNTSYPGQLDFTTQFCAGEPQGGKDACQGDSGGPLMVDDGQGGLVLGGIVSSGEGCGEAGKFGVYTRVISPEIRTWVASMVPKVQADQAAGSALLQKKAEFTNFSCSKKECTFDAEFAAGGAFVVKITISRSDRRKLGLSSKTITKATETFPGPASGTEHLTIGSAVRRGLKRAGLRSVKAKLFVVGQTTSGLRTSVTKTIRLRR